MSTCVKRVREEFKTLLWEISSRNEKRIRTECRDLRVWQMRYVFGSLIKFSKSTQLFTRQQSSSIITKLFCVIRDLHKESHLLVVM